MLLSDHRENDMSLEADEIAYASWDSTGLGKKVSRYITSAFHTVLKCEKYN
jgi:hypothetical protein